jgi:hypothetical protein
MVGEQGVARISRDRSTPPHSGCLPLSATSTTGPRERAYSAVAATARAASVTLPAGSSVHFRYLGENGLWFDDPDADTITDTGGVVQLPR